MFLQLLWTTFPFVQWEDTFNFHAKLLRCFLLSFLDAHDSKRILAVFRQRLVDVRLHDPISHSASPFGRHNNAIMRCPPRRYDTTSLPSFVAASQEDDQLMAVPLAFVPQLVNVTDGLYEEPTYSPVAFDMPGSDRVLLGSYDLSFTNVTGCILLWLFALAIIVWHFSRMARARSVSMRTICLPQTAAADANLDKRLTRLSPQAHLSIEGGTRGPVADIAEDVDHRLSMPGAWLHARCKQDTFDTHPDTVSGMIPRGLIYFCTQKVWARFLGTALTFVASGSNDMVTVRRTPEDWGSLVCQGLGSKKVDRVTGVTTPAVLDGRVVNCLPPKYVLSIRHRRGSDTAMCDRREPSSTGNAEIKDQVRTTVLDDVHEEKIGLAHSLVAFTHADRVLYQEDISSDGDESAVGNRTEGTEDDDDSFSIGTQRSASERKDEYRVLGRRLDGTGCPLSLRRVHSMGYLWRKRDIFDDDDDVTGDDSYWTEQVKARLFDARPNRCGSSGWPREGREDEADNWRIRDSQTTHSTPLEKASDVQPNGDSIKLRRYSSPPLSVHASLSDRAGRDDGPPGIYVVPQKRGQMAGGRHWSPVSSPRPADRHSGLSFFPFRETPSLLTPEAWRPGCLYVPDPPADESSQADAWWDNLGSIGLVGCHGGHVSDGGSVVPGSGAARDINTQVSWRDRYENDPASRRFSAVHRRAMTGG